MRTLTRVKWDRRVGEEVVLPQLGADLGVGFGPCRFQEQLACVSRRRR